MLLVVTDSYETFEYRKPEQVFRPLLVRFIQFGHQFPNRLGLPQCFGLVRGIILVVGAVLFGGGFCSALIRVAAIVTVGRTRDCFGLASVTEQWFVLASEYIQHIQAFDEFVAPKILH